MATHYLPQRNSAHGAKPARLPYPIYYVPNGPDTFRQSVLQFFQRHKFWGIFIVVLSLGAAERLCTSLGYNVFEIIYNWRFEILGGGLFLLTGMLFFIFRMWRQEQPSIPTEILQAAQPIPLKNNVLVFPKSAKSQQKITAEEVTISIDYWASRAPVKFTEDDLNMESLPEEFIAPDALVFSLQKTEA